MTNEAIGQVTLALRSLLMQGLTTASKVTLCSPWDDFGPDTGVNLFLYKVIENPQSKNMDWPRPPSHPANIVRPPLSLELFYLLTPYAPKITDPNTSTTDTAAVHKILGEAMLILHENPVLNDTYNYNTNPDAGNSDDFSVNLSDSFEKIKVTLNPIDMEEMSKIWSMGDKDYRLSVAYHVSLVQIEPVIPAVPAAAPVQEIGLKVTTLAPPVIAKLTPETGPVGTELHISGKNLWLKGLSTVVKVGGALIMDFVSAAENKIVITIPPDLKQGPEQGITVLVEGRESNPALFFVSPWITSIKPLRGAVDTGDPQALPIDIHGHGFQGAVQVSIGGVSVGSLDIVNENLIKTYVPNTLAKGHHIIDLQVDGNLANQRSFEVIE